jgi:hypothetical protein
MIEMFIAPSRIGEKKMRRIVITLASVFVVAIAVSLQAQQPAATGTNAAAAGNGQTAMKKAAAAKKYVFVMFWRTETSQTDKVWKSLQAATAKYAKRADIVSIQVTDPAEKAIVDRYNVSRSPMPLVLAVAPSGAVTKAFPVNFDDKQLSDAFVSPCEELCMKAIQSRKIVFVCVSYEASPDGKWAIPQGVKDFKADKQYTKATEVVVLNAADKKEAGFLKEMKIDTREKKPVSVLLAPGAMIGAFDAAATKQQIVAKLTSAQSGCCPGGNCGPGGCCPKK